MPYVAKSLLGERQSPSAYPCILPSRQLGLGAGACAAASDRPLLMRRMQGGFNTVPKHESHVEAEGQLYCPLDRSVGLKVGTCAAALTNRSLLLRRVQGGI